MPEIEVETSHGPARVHLQPVANARGGLVLGHGAGGGIGAKDLQTSTQAALGERFAVALVEQPYRVAGRRSPPGASQLDTAWSAVVQRLREQELHGLPLVFGGRSAGARVACRTAAAGRAAAVLCLAFPLLPPRRAASSKEPKSRLPELDALAVPTLVIQGTRDPFGMPPPGPQRTVVEVAGDHSLRTDLTAVGEAVRSWFAGLTDLTSRPAVVGNHAPTS